MTTASKTGDVNEFFSRFRRKLCLIHGYDEYLNYIGGTRSEPEAAGTKAFLEPRDFLAYAIEDSRTLDEPKSLVNCLTNCKRGIDAQIDRMIHRLGFLPLARKQRWPVPRKLSFISDSGILAPKILKKLNELRNRLEHEFAVPSRQQVEDALEIATLFVSYAELVEIPTLNCSLSKTETIRYDYGEMVFHFFERYPDDGDDETEPSFSIPYGDALFQGVYDFLTKTVPLMSRRRASK